MFNIQIKCDHINICLLFSNIKITVAHQIYFITWHFINYMNSEKLSFLVLE